MLNQKGGVGKTSVTLGLASAAMWAGRRVLVVDLDPQASSTWVLADADLDEGRAAPAAGRLLAGGGASAAARAVTPSSWGDGVDLVPARPELAGWEHATGRDADPPAHGPARPRRRVRRHPRRLPARRSGTSPGPAWPPPTWPSSSSSRPRSGCAGISAVADTIDGVWEEDNPELDLAGVIVNKVPGVSAEAERRLDELVNVVGRRPSGSR